ncbi:MAG: YnbE family lipoprotein [Nitrosomonas sp.]|nr:YnbE family lipoprotein [Nitrosomonas sp.]
MRNIDRMTHTTIVIALLILCCLVITACAPTVKVETPKEPITINLNIKLDADIRVKLEEEAKKDIAANPGIF